MAKPVVLPNDVCNLCGGGFGSTEAAWEHVRIDHPEASGEARQRQPLAAEGSGDLGQCSHGIPSLSPPLERCSLPEGHEGECQ